MKYVVVLVLFVVTVAACFLLGDYLSRRKHKTRTKVRSPSVFPLSAFSVLDHPAAAVGQEQFTPLREAAMYMTYGKKQEAKQVLNTALRKGEVTDEDVKAFWANYSSGE